MKILIIGGTGTFGSAAAEYFLEKGNVVTIFSRDEQKQELLAGKLRRFSNVQFFLGDVRDRDRLKMAMRGRHAVIHAAALKIVPRCEFDPIEAVKTNIGGAQNIIECALELARGALVTKVLLISTDKAVQPVNLYGATKKTAEHLIRAANNLAYNRLPVFSAVRYGNVFRSRGSVIEAWERAVEEGRPVGVTDLRMTRFFMLPQEAVALAGYALEEMEGGEIFIPKLRAYRLKELHTAFRAVYPHAQMKVLGVRPGEKTHEDLISSYELPFTYACGDCLVIGSERHGNGGEFSKFASSAGADAMSVNDLRDHIRGRQNGTKQQTFRGQNGQSVRYQP